VQGSTVPVNEKKEDFCNFCKAEWTEMEVLDNVGPEGFLCHRCNHVLQWEADRNAGGHEQSTRLNDQFKFITELLPKIDAVHIPECDFDRAFAKARPVMRDATHQRAATVAVDAGGNRPMAVKGLTNLGPQSIAVNISTSDGPSAAEMEAERARKEQVAKQNALPSWMSKSTLTGESFQGGVDPLASTARGAVENKDQVSGSNVDSKVSAQIDDLFEKLKAEHAAERAREIEEEDGSGSEEDEDEDEFEDVQAANTGSEQRDTATPSIQRDKSEILSREDSSEERQTKRVKVEADVTQEPAVDEDDDEDELEFEDV
jgi:transcription initiation factor TFIIE subunit alpha